MPEHIRESVVGDVGAQIAALEEELRKMKFTRDQVLHTSYGVVSRERLNSLNEAIASAEEHLVEARCEGGVASPEESYEYQVGKILEDVAQIEYAFAHYAKTKKIMPEKVWTALHDELDRVHEQLLELDETVSAPETSAERRTLANLMRRIRMQYPLRPVARSAAYVVPVPLPPQRYPFSRRDAVTAVLATAPMPPQQPASPAVQVPPPSDTLTRIQELRRQYEVFAAGLDEQKRAFRARVDELVAAGRAARVQQIKDELLKGQTPS